MCKSENVKKVEELLGITETREKYNSMFNKNPRKTTNAIENKIEKIALSFSK